jgi:hypothetical protein
LLKENSPKNVCEMFLKCSRKISTFLMKNLIAIGILIPEKDVFVKGKCPSFVEFLKNKNFVKGLYF